MVQLSQVTQSYFGQPRVLDQVNLELKKGEFVYVLGGSGAGESVVQFIPRVDSAKAAVGSLGA